MFSLVRMAAIPCTQTLPSHIQYFKHTEVITSVSLNIISQRPCIFINFIGQVEVKIFFDNLCLSFNLRLATADR